MMARTLDVNQHLAVVGGMGRPQWVAFFLCGIAVAQFGWAMLSVIFTLKVPNFRCADDGLLSRDLSNSTVVKEFDNKCEHSVIQNNVTVTTKCSKFVYDRENGETVIEAFDLICDRKYISTMCEMIYMAFVGLGTLLSSILSDRFGRKKLIMVTCMCSSITGVIQAFSVNITMYMAFRILNGFFISSIFAPLCSLLAEIVSPKRRPDILNGMEFFWIFGTGSLSLVCYLLKDWWKIQLFSSIPNFIASILMIWGLFESPHWLASAGKVKEALEILGNMAKAKGIDTKDLSFNPSDYDQTKDSNKTKSESFLRVCVHRRLMVRFFIFSYCWTTCSVCYYVLMFGVRTLPGNIYINNFISVAVEALGYILCFSIAWLGRKWPAVSAFLLGSAAMLVSVLAGNFGTGPSIDKLVTAMSMMGKLCITAAWQVIIVWSNELYPTTHRCTLFALNTIVSKVGSVLSPFLLQIEDFIEVPNEKLIMPILFVTLMAIGGLLTMILPETNKRRMPENCKEANVASFPMNSEPTDGKLADVSDMSDQEAEKYDLLEPEDLVEKI